MADEPLLDAAGRIADGEIIDWGSITGTLPSEEERALAEELAIVAQIAAEHRQLHQLLPVAPDTPSSLVPDRARWGHLDLLNWVGLARNLLPVTLGNLAGGAGMVGLVYWVIYRRGDSAKPGSG